MIPHDLNQVDLIIVISMIAMGWSGIMEWNGVEWILVEDAFWSFWVILTLLDILGLNLVVFAQTNKKVNSSTRRRQRHLTS